MFYGTGLSGKDLGKKGTDRESVDVPEALGLVVGTVYIVCCIFSLYLFEHSQRQQMIYNSALFSVCFMIFLGFVDDTLDLKWRYKLVLPPIASLPLLSAYSGNSALYVPHRFRSWFMTAVTSRVPTTYTLTTLGSFVCTFEWMGVTVDKRAAGAIIELGPIFLVFMGLLAVFCTNAINIYAGEAIYVCNLICLFVSAV
jgi:UDP-N-acetylglucosamine--dolichyl-phosphate N-acetylglucosaminephosphotransferase